MKIMRKKNDTPLSIVNYDFLEQWYSLSYQQNIGHLTSNI